VTRDAKKRKDSYTKVTKKGVDVKKVEGLKAEDFR